MTSRTIPDSDIPAEIEKTEHEIKRHKAKIKEARSGSARLEEQLAALASAVGLSGPATGDEIAAAYDGLLERTKEATLRRVFTEVALEEGVDPDFTLNYLRGRGDIDADIDPEDPRTPDHLAATIRAAAADVPRLVNRKAKMAAQQRRQTDTNANQAPIAPDAIADMTTSQINRAYSEGRLDPLLGRP